MAARPPGRTGDYKRRRPRLAHIGPRSGSCHADAADSGPVGRCKPLVGSSDALGRGIIVARPDAFEKSAATDTIAFDKTGILTTANMSVMEVAGSAGIFEYVPVVERLSTHPVARAIARLPTTFAVSDIDIHPGKGALATVDGRCVAVGSRFEGLNNCYGTRIIAREQVALAAADGEPWRRLDRVRVKGRAATQRLRRICRELAVQPPAPGWEAVTDIDRK